MLEVRRGFVLEGNILRRGFVLEGDLCFERRERIFSEKRNLGGSYDAGR